MLARVKNVTAFAIQKCHRRDIDSFPTEVSDFRAILVGLNEASLPYGSESELDALERGFLECSLTHPEWTHQAHVAVATLFVLRMDPADAMQSLRSGIRALNASQGVVTTMERGYHETITAFWIAKIHEFVSKLPQGLSRAEIVHAVLMACPKTLPMDYFSRDRLMSADARFGYISPDLKPFPELDALALAAPFVEP